MEIIGGIAAIIGIVTGLWFLYEKLIPEKNKGPESDWIIEEKEVSSSWIDKSGVKDIWEAKGYTVVWSNLDKVEERLLNGYVYATQENEEDKVKYKLVRKSQMLLGKPIT